MINRVPLERIALASEAVFAESRVDGRDMAFAVVDEAGGLVFGVRYENTATRVLTHSIRKAYTSAIMRRDTIAFRDEDRERDKTLADWGDMNLTHLVGGVVIKMEGEWFGGLGVGGNSTERDDEIARIALAILTNS
ncbi:MAG TPA: heme-binding protein [Acidimicrobiales bacterium]|nr:heme-binding protein [Acidimicrobiales bacterium]